MMQSGTACQRTVGLAVAAPFSVTKSVKLVQRNGIYVGSVPIDGLLPGRCDWGFSHLVYSVASRGTQTYVPQGDLVHYDGEGSVVERMNIWCVGELEHLVQKQSQYWGEYCRSLNDLKHTYPGKISVALAGSASPSVPNQGPPIVMDADTNYLLVTFHDLGDERQ
jgi:hypothetical protein